MLSQFALDFKRLARTSTTIVGYLAFMLVLLISFFYYINDGDIGAVQQFNNFSQTMTQLDHEITQLRKAKTLSQADAALLANKTKQKAMIDDVLLAASAEQGTAGMVVTNPDPVNRRVLKLARYQLKETEAGRGDQLVLFKIEGESFDASVLGRKETVLLYETLLKQHRHQQYFNAPPAAGGKLPDGGNALRADGSTAPGGVGCVAGGRLCAGSAPAYRSAATELAAWPVFLATSASGGSRPAGFADAGRGSR